MNRCFRGASIDGRIITVHAEESIDEKWAKKYRYAHEQANQLEVLQKLLCYLWPGGQDEPERRECACANCRVYEMPRWGQYNRNPAGPCLPGSHGITLGEPMQTVGCGAPAGMECRPHCPHLEARARSWNESHGCTGVVCTMCGVEVHHPKRDGCDGKQHRKHGPRCFCSGRHPMDCAICEAPLLRPYVGSGHKPPADELKAHKKTCGFRQFWEKQKTPRRKR